MTSVLVIDDAALSELADRPDAVVLDHCLDRDAALTDSQWAQIVKHARIAYGVL